MQFTELYHKNTQRYNKQVIVTQFQT